jgi:hypothetical protein
MFSMALAGVVRVWWSHRRTNRMGLNTELYQRPELHLDGSLQGDESRRAHPVR